ncbi:FKBP-type peptidyl-prolyl cis-trans isomerase [Porifericola rhodea]|uniref:FKBP-type peptidyl-prolyl cis-trans isomerase n=1 Tax=Porifericola rhodea TaxID=930972 RepID=UPI002665ED3F|nr:FKBP-type peptidyl-prolyl cis-trans isomerase [Porifericola rhodea]WKN33894.1 FKBP-type peptidyl-prolyl cis-trans isomerase [Porifericola rhodea]
MVVEENRIITLSYKLRDGDVNGNVMEVMDIAYPFIFYYKSDGILDSFQENLRGLSSGDTFSFIIPATHAYGPYTKDNIAAIPIERFVVDEEMADSIRDVGEYVAVTDDDGYTQNGKVVEKNATHLKVDFNHAMAGKDLHFSGRILNIRQATADESVQKRYIMPDGIRF